WDSLHDESSLAGALLDLAGAYHFIGETAKALERAQQALSAARTIPDRALEARALIMQAAFNIARNEYDEALKHYDEALRIYTEINNTVGESTVFSALGALYHQFGDTPNALDYYSTAIVLYRKAG